MIVAAFVAATQKSLILRENPSGPSGVSLLSVSTGIVTPIPYDRTSSEDLEMIDHLQGWDRVCGDKNLYSRRQEKQNLNGSEVWVDTFLRVGNGEPVNVSNYDGANCGQASLSADGTRVVFIRADEK